MDDWIEVFRVGAWTDSQGRTRHWSAGDLDAIAAATSASLGLAGREAPAVIGHPATDDPAYGWVAAIKREGERLLVRFRDLVPEFVAMVRGQMFPNRSIALNADRSLRHVGFLGAKPPAVAGLAPIAHTTPEPEAVIEFTLTTEDAMPQKTFKEKLLEFLGLAQELDIEVMLPSAAPKKDAATFTQADVDAASEKAREDERARVTTAAALETRKASIATFCAGLKDKGQLLPAWEKAGLVTFMEQLAEHGDVVAFAGGAETQTPLAWFQAFLGGLPKLINFEEVARAEGKKPETLSATQRDINRQLGVPDALVVKFAQN